MTTREQLNDLDWEGMFQFVDRIEGAAHRDVDEAYERGLTRGWFYGFGSRWLILVLLGVSIALMALDLIARWMP